MRITTYEKGGNSLNPFIKLSIFLIIILCLFVMPVSAQLMDSSWAMFGMDLQHTSQSPYRSTSNGTIAWIYNIPNYWQVYSSPAIDSNGTIYFGANDGILYALYKNGTKKWSTNLNCDWSSPAIDSNGIIYVGSDNNAVYAVHPNGTLKWTYSTINDVSPSVAIGTDGTIYAGEYDNKLHAINSDGTEKWIYDTGSQVFDSSPAIDSNGIIYIGTYNGKLHAVNTDGTEKWNYSAGADIPTAPAIASDGTIYFGSINSFFYALNQDGTLKWNYDTGGGIESSPSIATDGTIYFGSDDSDLYALHPNGTLKWSYNTGNAIDSSPAIDFDGTIYFGSNDKNFRALYPNGTLKWSISNSEYFRASPSISNDGTIYVGASEWKMYAFFSIASAAAPEFDDVSWDYDPYYTGETANITTNILNFDAGTYSYYLDLYNTQEYLTTYEITSETESNYYTFPTEWMDTSLLAKLQRVTDPYGSNEVNLAMDLSHFETLNWDTTVSFNQSSYNPGETLKVTWSGAPTGSTVWLRAMNDGEIIKPNVDYSGSFEFTIPSNTQETYYLVDVITNGVSQIQASCIINIGDYWVPDYIYVSNYSFSDGNTYSLHNVDRAEYLNVTTETNINTDFVDVYYNNVYDDRTVSIDHIENLDGTDQVLKFPNDLGSGQYITIIYYHNVTTGTQAELSYYTNVGEKGEGIDIYNAVITMDDTKEILDIESIAGYGGNDLVVPSDRIVIFDIYADEIINSTIITENYRYEGDANYNSTSDYHIKRSYLFDVLGLTELQFEVHNDATNTDDIIKYNVYVQGIDQTDLDGSVVMYWTKTEIELNEDVLLYFNVSDMPNNPILTIVSTGDSKYTTERTLYTNQTGTESIPDYYKEIGTYMATITCNDIIYAISTLTIIDPDEDEVIIIEDTTFQDNTTSLLNSPYLIGLFIMCVFLAIGATNGIGGTIVTGSMGLGIVCYMGIFPWILLVIEVLVVAVLMAKGMINLSGD